MRTFDRFRRMLATVAIALVLVTTLPVGALHAGLVTTDEVITQTYDTDATRAKLSAFMARADVKQQLAALGVEPAEAEARIAALSDDEIQAMAGKIEQLPAGGSIFVTAAIVAGVLLFVLIITDLAGITNVFTFIN